MAAATVVPDHGHTLAPGLRRCTVVRFSCAKCGEYTVYLEADIQPSPICPNCQQINAVIVAVATGWTTRTLPWSDSKKLFSTTSRVLVDTRKRRAARGAPDKLSEEEKAQVRSRHANGQTAEGLAMVYGVSRRTIWNVLKEGK